MLHPVWYYLMLKSAVLGYLLGSIPFGLLLTRWAKLGDLRTMGSGNIGATNVLRTGHKKLALATLLLDAGKGFLAVTLTEYLYNDDLALLAGGAAALGHVFSVWLKFKGGKGVATIFGVFFAINWIFGLSVGVIWLAFFYVSGFASLASIVSIGYSWLAAYLLDTDFTAFLCLNFALLVLYTHRANIERLLNGTEPPMRKGMLT